MTEAQLEASVGQLCQALGILRFHVRDSRGMTPGFPDDVLIGKRGILWRELKSASGNLTPEQRAVGYALQALGADWSVWRPVHWWSGRIQAELEAIR